MLSAAKNGMIGVPSGWERDAAWCWFDQPSYAEAIAMLHEYIDNGEYYLRLGQPIPICTEDDFADYTEHPDNVPDVYIHRE